MGCVLPGWAAIVTPLTFGQDRTCPTCKGSGRILRGELECGVCRGTGIATTPAPPPSLPTGGTTGAAHPETSHAAEASLEQASLQRAHRRILELLDGGQMADEPMADILTLEGLSSPNGFRARRGELAKAGLIDVVPDKTVRTRAGRRARLWYITAAGVQVLATVEYRERKPGSQSGDRDR